MPRPRPTLVVNVSLTGSDRDYDEQVTFLGHRFRIVRLGTDGDVAAAEALVRRWADMAAAIAVTGVREARTAGLYDGSLAAVERVKRATSTVPVTDGHALRDVLQEWAIRHVDSEMPGYFTKLVIHFTASRRVSLTRSSALPGGHLNAGQWCLCGPPQPLQAVPHPLIRLGSSRQLDVRS